MREIEYSNKEFGNKLAKNVIRELGLKCEPAEIQSNIHSWGYFIGNESGLSIVCISTDEYEAMSPSIYAGIGVHLNPLDQ